MPTQHTLELSIVLVLLNLFNVYIVSTPPIYDFRYDSLIFETILLYEIQNNSDDEDDSLIYGL